MCIGASGCMSLKAMISSSSYTLLDGISPFIILQKILINYINNHKFLQVEKLPASVLISLEPESLRRRRRRTDRSPWAELPGEVFPTEVLRRTDCR